MAPPTRPHPTATIATTITAHSGGNGSVGPKIRYGGVDIIFECCPEGIVFVQHARSKSDATRTADDLGWSLGGFLAQFLYNPDGNVEI